MARGSEFEFNLMLNYTALNPKLPTPKPHVYTLCPHRASAMTGAQLFLKLIQAMVPNTAPPLNVNVGLEFASRFIPWPG